MFKKNSKIKVVDSDFCYPIFEEMAEQMGLTKFDSGFSDTFDDEIRIVITKPYMHPHKHVFLYGVYVPERDVEIIIEEKGISHHRSKRNFLQGHFYWVKWHSKDNYVPASYHKNFSLEEGYAYTHPMFLVHCKDGIFPVERHNLYDVAEEVVK